MVLCRSSEVVGSIGGRACVRAWVACVPAAEKTETRNQPFESPIVVGRCIKKGVSRCAQLRTHITSPSIRDD